MGEKREIIVAARKRREKPKTIAVWVNVSVPSVYRICGFEKQNRLKLEPFPGRKSVLTPELLEKIRETVLENNDITLEWLIRLVPKLESINLKGI